MRPLLIAIVAALSAGTAGAQPAPPPTQAQLAACLTRLSVVGLPRHRAEAAKAEQTALVCRAGYALSFNGKTRNPDWVIERLSPSDLVGPAVRRDNFQADAWAPKSPGPLDYDGARDRGHQAPAGDAKSSQPRMDDSFYMSNMSPQQGPGFNRGEWKYLEEAVRSWVLCGGHADVVVMTGPVYGDSKVTIGPPGAPILVPEAYYKIVYDVQTGRAVGFKLPNRKMTKTDIAAFVTKISQIEDETGLDFFPLLTQKRQAQIETSKGLVWGHAQACQSQSPD